MEGPSGSIGRRSTRRSMDPSSDAGEADVADGRLYAVAGATVAAALPVHGRVAIVERLADLVDRDAERLAATMTWQTGKPIRETRREVVRAADTLRLSARAADLLAGEQIPTDTTPGGRPLWAFSHRRPIGVVAAITPFNAPLNLLAHKLGPSIIGGNATIVKPASAAPLTAVQLVELAIEAGCPPDDRSTSSSVRRRWVFRSSPIPTFERSRSPEARARPGRSGPRRHSSGW